MIGPLRRAVRGLGWDLIRWTGFTHPLGKRLMLLRHHGVTTVLDVGANEGQFAKEMRLARFRGRIVSFEPLAEPYARLVHASRADPSWTAVNLALGDSDRTVSINVSANSISSSILPMLEAHEQSAVNASFVGVEHVEQRRLDSVFTDHVREGERTYLKIDVQGFELHVLEGAAGVLDRVTGIQTELSFVPLYAGGPLFDDVVSWMRARDFELVGLEPGFADPRSGRLLQCDGIFYRV